MGRGMEWKAIRRGESNEGIRGAYSEPKETEDVSEFLEGDGSEIEKLIDGIDTSMDEGGTPKAEEKSEKRGPESEFFENISSLIKSEEEQAEYFITEESEGQSLEDLAQQVDDDKKKAFLRNLQKRMNGEKVQEEDPKKKFLEDIRKQMNGEAR